MGQNPAMKRITLDIWEDEITDLTQSLHFGSRSHLLRMLLGELSKQVRNEGSAAFIYNWLNGVAPLTLKPIEKKHGNSSAVSNISDSTHNARS